MISQDCLSSLARHDGGSVAPVTFREAETARSYAREETLTRGRRIRTVSRRLDAHKQFHYSAHVGPVIRFCRRKRPAVLQGATFAQQHRQPAIQCVQALGGITA
jgi:hypothetical protein